MNPTLQKCIKAWCEIFYLFFIYSPILISGLWNVRVSGWQSSNRHMWALLCSLAYLANLTWSKFGVDAIWLENDNITTYILMLFESTKRIRLHC